MGLGLAIACGRVSVAILIAIYVVVALGAAIRSEEAFLRRTFGNEYDRYRRGRSGRQETPKRFSWQRALANHELRTVAGLLVAVLLLVLKATYNGSFWR
jgi:hypothetical protein